MYSLAFPASPLRARFIKCSEAGKERRRSGSPFPETGRRIPAPTKSNDKIENYGRQKFRINTIQGTSNKYEQTIGKGKKAEQSENANHFHDERTKFQFEVKERNRVL